jgi:hypothetical protein
VVSRADIVSAMVQPGAPQSVNPDFRYSAGIISAGVAMRKYFEIRACPLICRRASIASWIARPTSS